VSCSHDRALGDCDRCDKLDRLNALFETVEDIFIERSWKVRACVPLMVRESLPDNEQVYLCWGPCTPSGWKLFTKSTNVAAPRGSQGWNVVLLRSAPREVRILAANKLFELRQALMVEMSKTDQAVSEAVAFVEAFCRDTREPIACQGTPGAASWGRCEKRHGHAGACTHDPEE
jgi:hypothetical protein